MRSEIDEVWERDKDTARENQRDGYPSSLTVRELIVQYFREANASPWRPDGAIDMYAGELLAMIHEQRMIDGRRPARTASSFAISVLVRL